MSIWDHVQLGVLAVFQGPALFELEFRDSLTEMDSRYPLSRAQASRE